jgi:hypothetical protein
MRTTYDHDLGKVGDVIEFPTKNQLLFKAFTNSENQNLSNNDDFGFTLYYRRFTIFQEDHSNPAQFRLCTWIA